MRRAVMGARKQAEPDGQLRELKRNLPATLEPARNERHLAAAAKPGMPTDGEFRQRLRFIFVGSAARVAFPKWTECAISTMIRPD